MNGKEKIDAALRESEARYKTLYESSRDAIMMIAPPMWKFVAGNQATLELFGAQSEEELITKGPWDISPEYQPDGQLSSEKAKATIGHALQEGSHFFEWQHMKLDGKEFPATVLLTRIELEGKQMLQATVRDITEHKQAEKQSQEQNEFLNSILESLTYPFYVLDANDYTIKMANSTAWSGKLPEKTTCHMLSHKRDTPCDEADDSCPCPVDEIKRTKKPAVTEHVHYDKEGNRQYVEVHGYPIFDRLGNLTQIIEYSIDITERKRAEETIKTAYEQLEQSNMELKEMQSQLVQNEKLASIGQLAAGVAHEMNTPVGFVASNFRTLENYLNKFLELLAGYKEVVELVDTGTKEQRLTKLQEITEKHDKMKIDFILEDIQGLFDDSREGLDRVTNVIQNLRDFSRIDQPGSRDKYNINEGIEATLVVANNAIKYDADIKTDFSEVPMIFCHSGQINQVFLNILVNAAQAIKTQERDGNGTITIRTYSSEDEDKVICEFADDGPGIPPEALSKIFDPFFTTKPVGKGTGLGLSVSHDIIVNKHNGELLVDSKVGEGTKFIIKLPIGTKENDEKEIMNDGKENSVICGR